MRKEREAEEGGKKERKTEKKERWKARV